MLRVDMYIHSHSERVQACGNQYLYLSLMLHLFAIQVKKVTDMSPVLADQVLKWSLKHLCIDVLRFPPYVVGSTIFCLWLESVLVVGCLLGIRKASTSCLYP